MQSIDHLVLGDAVELEYETDWTGTTETLRGTVTDALPARSPQRSYGRVTVETDDGRRVGVMFSGSVFDLDSGREIGFGADAVKVGAA